MKRKLTVLLAIVMLLCIGCGKKNDNTTGTTEPAQTQIAVETGGTAETAPGTAENILDPEGFEEDEEETVPPESENQDEEQTRPTEPKATEPESTKPKETEPEETKPQETKPEETQPAATEPGETQPDAGEDKVTYEEYNDMSPEEQVAFFNQFASMEDFVAWYNQAKAEYEEENGAIDVGDGNIDLGDLGKS